MSSVLTFGSAALWRVTEAEANAAIELAIGHGVNHFDVAPAYGQAEMRLGPWMEKHTKRSFWRARQQSAVRAKHGRA